MHLIEDLTATNTLRQKKVELCDLVADNSASNTYTVIFKEAKDAVFNTSHKNFIKQELTKILVEPAVEHEQSKFSSPELKDIHSLKKPFLFKDLHHIRICSNSFFLC